MLRTARQTELVLRGLADAGDAWRHGYDLCRHVGLPAGAVYTALMRLADRGLLETSWESDPPRHAYRLTVDGRAVAADLARPRARRSPPILPRWSEA